MRFAETPLTGAFVVEIEPHADERGVFARTFDEAAFAERGLVARFPEHSTSFNARAGVTRGMHYAAAPHEEVKLVRCTRGAVHDVLVDLRPDSPTFRAWHAEELTAENRRALYVPRGLAHGFQALEDGSEVLYLIDSPYEASAARGVRWDDPAFGIDWPVAPERILSERDRTWPDFAA
ncbi:MAG: dTDP-4-dehydrorhamnose 3,5-epimerase [Solirubrobacteraceae bacterium]|jgi:dTDP-4-dehydrorhamnose 3,5-epimerase|nr:dTDP-4-dehydrorhamnose 3,5-epimerase [Solirubrobacteraceae bacterium]